MILRYGTNLKERQRILVFFWTEVFHFLKAKSPHLGILFLYIYRVCFSPTHLAEIRTIRVIAVHAKLLGCTACNWYVPYSFSRFLIIHTRGSVTMRSGVNVFVKNHEISLPRGPVT
jgi:hypothetical protein